MGAVWRATDTVLDRDVAVKVLDAHFAADDAFRRRFHREARAAARLDHSNIARVHDFGEDQSDPRRPVQYLVIELLAGQTLADRLQSKQPLPWSEAARLGSDIADALAAAHAQGVVHRDVTPRNIMLTPSGPKLLDFGIAVIAGDTPATSTAAIGTPAYIAPELIQRQPATPAADVYSLAAVLVHAVTGRPPFPGDLTEQAHAHLHQPPPALQEAPPHSAALLQQCLAKNPDERPSANDVANRLRADAPVAHTAAMPPLPPDDAGKTRALAVPHAGRRFGTAAIVVAAAVAGFALTAIAVVLLRDDDNGATPSTSPAQETQAQETQTPEQQETEQPLDVEPAPAELGAADAAFKEIERIGTDAVRSGDLSFGDATDIGRSLRIAVTQAGNANFGAAERTVDRLADRLKNRAEEGAIDSFVADELEEQLDVIADELDEVSDD